MFHKTLKILYISHGRIDPQTHPDPTMEYYKRDLGYLNSISTAFLTHVLNKHIREMDDRMQVFIDPLPANTKINTMLSDLKVELNKDNISREALRQIYYNYDSITSDIYKLAIRANEFPGSDIWGFFKRRVKDICIRDDYRNTLIILTDGYMFHEANISYRDSNTPNRSSYLTHKMIEDKGITMNNFTHKINEEDYGFIKANNNLDNLEVLLIGINTNNNQTDFEIIKMYWDKWFDEMGVTKRKYLESNLPGDNDELIKLFIWGEI